MILFYCFVFDSFNQYKQQHIVTISQPNHTKNNKNIENEQMRMREELEKIKQSANADFIYNTLATNLNKISSYANIEFNDTRSSLQVKSKQEVALIPQAKSTLMVNKMNSIDYVPYRHINTHDIPNAFDILNTPTNMKQYNTNHFDIKTTQTTQKDRMKWAIPTIKDAKIYHTTNIYSKVLAINKNGIKMQVIDTKSSWAHVRYAVKRESFIEGYIPTNNIKFVQ